MSINCKWAAFCWLLYQDAATGNAGADGGGDDYDDADDGGSAQFRCGLVLMVIPTLPLMPLHHYQFHRLQWPPHCF